ncbi:hypothetical protein ACFQ88_03300 [Paenibacillus sp. NPDC056579]|uniref:hypothetical protein n=1 Tax=Paenibacillus sp. NPDC056579 TaxID=3345871 RepID=UPI00367DA254
MNLRVARIGLLLDLQAAEKRWRYGYNIYSLYLEEILAHAGIRVERVSNARDIQTSRYDMVIDVLGDHTKEQQNGLWEYMERGGRLVSYGRGHVWAERLGFVRQSTIRYGYAHWREGELPVPGIYRLRFVEASPWSLSSSVEKPNGSLTEKGNMTILTPGGPSGGTMLQSIQVGNGYLERWAVDIPQTIVRMQQGMDPVLEDGVPAPDGSAVLNEGILKADDAIALDWEFDRKATDTGALYFAEPQADLWRSVLISHLISIAQECGVVLPFVGLWPEGTKQVALISHDSDVNQDEHALSTLKLLQETGIRSTWCMIEPGYSPHIYDQVKAAGHELAFHYNALDEQGGRWDGDEFDRQLEWLKRAANLTSVTSNKNHYTRFEGWGELFLWCEKNQIAVDQTRGPSKRGNVGFLFGTCHPYYPMAWADERNRLYDVLEVGFLTQDMDLAAWSDSSVIVPFLEGVMKVEGVAHFLFHQIHIHNREAVRDAFRKLVREARSRQFEFWTCAEINEWTRKRRQAVIKGLDDQGGPIVENAQAGTVVWIPVDAVRESNHSEALEVQYGVTCRKYVVQETTNNVR